MNVSGKLPALTTIPPKITPSEKNIAKDEKPIEPQKETAKSDTNAKSPAELSSRAAILIQKSKKTETAKPSESFTKMTAQHILVKEEKEAIKLKQELDECKTPEEKEAKFAELAKKHSKCPSGKKSGSLGEFEKGDMVPAFENAAASLEIGEISQPVKTDFGWHLIKVNEKK